MLVNYDKEVDVSNPSVNADLLWQFWLQVIMTFNLVLSTGQNCTVVYESESQVLYGLFGELCLVLHGYSVSGELSVNCLSQDEQILHAHATSYNAAKRFLIIPDKLCGILCNLGLYRKVEAR